MALTIPASGALCRALGLPVRIALLIVCGNAICGHSAIAALGLVIGVESGDVAAAIALTACSRPSRSCSSAASASAERAAKDQSAGV